MVLGTFLSPLRFLGELDRENSGVRYPLRISPHFQESYLCPSAGFFFPLVEIPPALHPRSQSRDPPPAASFLFVDRSSGGPLKGGLRANLWCHRLLPRVPYPPLPIPSPGGTLAKLFVVLSITGLYLFPLLVSRHQFLFRLKSSQSPPQTPPSFPTIMKLLHFNVFEVILHRPTFFKVSLFSPQQPFLDRGSRLLT